MLARDLSPCSKRTARAAGFSLVEVALAAGIAAVSILMLFALIPSGLGMFRESINVSTSSQIGQRILYEAVQTDYETLLGIAAGEPIPTTPVLRPWRYFDDQGLEVSAPAQAVYHVLTRVLATSQLPNNSAGFTNTSLATVTVQVALNPTNRSIPLVSSAGADPMASTIKPDSGVTFHTYNNHIARTR